MKYAPIYILFWMLVFHTSCGQNQIEPHKDNIDYNIKDTIRSYGPNTMVRNVTQDSKGNILFTASWSGVFRYDGISFTNITSKIGSRRFWDVLEDRRGNLWFGSTDSGVYHYNGKTFQHFTTREGLVDNQVMRIYEDKAGNIWIGTGGGVSRHDGKSFRNFTTKDGLANNDITNIMEDKTGKLWFGTRGELCFYDGTKFTVLKNHDGKPFINVWAITEDEKGNIWFGHVDGLWRYDGRTLMKASERGAYAIIQDKAGNIWTTGGVKPEVWALSRYDAKSLYDTTPAMTEIKSGERMVFLGLLEANDGSIWFGSMNGVYRYDGKTTTDFKDSASQK